MQPHMPPPAPTGAAYLESRIATQGGYLWPVDRHRMVSPGAIRERMAEDLAQLRAGRLPDECVTLDDLARLGWCRVQVTAYADAAFAAVKAQLRAQRLSLRRAA